MIKLVITDLDGTFLNSQGSFDKTLFKQVKELMDDRKVKFAMCTGKQCERVEELLGENWAQDVWILGDSATRIKYRGEYVYQSFLPNSIGLTLISRLENIPNSGVIIACTTKGATILETTPPDLMEKVRKSYRNVLTVKDYQAIQDDFVKITLYDPLEQCFETIKSLQDMEEQAYMVASEAAWIDISNQGVHKGTTVRKLQEMLDITPAETMVFGDGLNDRELLLSGGYRFAVRNAFDEIKDMADYITLSNDQNGVLVAIQDFISLQPSLSN